MGLRQGTWSFFIVHKLILRPPFEIIITIATSLFTVARLVIMGMCVTYKGLGENFKQFLEQETSIKGVSGGKSSVTKMITLLTAINFFR